MNAAEDVDLIFVNGNIYTVNERQPRAEAFAVKDQRIVFVGANEDAEKFRDNETRIVDLGGKTVVPGFTDSHCHIFGIGEREMNLHLEGTNTLEDFLAKVRERVAKAERPSPTRSRRFLPSPNGLALLDLLAAGSRRLHEGRPID